MYILLLYLVKYDTQHIPCIYVFNNMNGMCTAMCGFAQFYVYLCYIFFPFSGDYD